MSCCGIRKVILIVLSFRAFGDKSGPPSLPDAEMEEHGLNGEECEGEEKVEEEEECEVEACAEEAHSSTKDVTDEACSGVEELSLADHIEQEKNQGNQKTPQGTRSRQ